MKVTLELVETQHARKTLKLGLQAFLISHEKAATEFVGNRTECALLVLLRGWGVSYEVLRARHADDVEQLYAFSSERKMASVLMRTPSGFCLYNKARTSPALGQERPVCGCACSCAMNKHAPC